MQIINSKQNKRIRKGKKTTTIDCITWELAPRTSCNQCGNQCGSSHTGRKKYLKKKFLPLAGCGLHDQFKQKKTNLVWNSESFAAYSKCGSFLTRVYFDDFFQFVMNAENFVFRGCREMKNYFSFLVFSHNKRNKNERKKKSRNLDIYRIM